MYKTNYKMKYIGDKYSFNLIPDKYYTVKIIGEDEDSNKLLVINDDNKLVWYAKIFFETDVLEERKDKIIRLKEIIHGRR